MSMTASDLMLNDYDDDGSCTLMGFTSRLVSYYRWQITHRVTSVEIITDPERTLRDIIRMLEDTLPLYEQNGVDMRTVRLEVSWPTALELYTLGVLTKSYLTSGRMHDGDLLSLPGVHPELKALPVDICSRWNGFGSYFGLIATGPAAA